MKTVLTGITRNLSDSTKEDGQLEEMMNLRHDGALLRPIGVPEEIKLYENYGKTGQTEYTLLEGEKIVFVHQFKGREFVVSYRVIKAESNLYLLGELIGDRVEVVNTNIIRCSSPIKIVQLGIFLYVFTEDKGYSLRMEYDEKVENIRYTDVSLSKLEFNLYARERVKTITRSFFSTDNDEEGTIKLRVEASRYISSNTGGFLELLNEVKNDDGLMYDATIIRAAVRLRSGDYVFHTAPILLHPIGYQVLKFKDLVSGNPTMESGGSFEYYSNFGANVDINGYKIDIIIPRIENIKEFEEEIECVDLFMAVIPNILTDSTKPLITKTLGQYIKVDGDLISTVESYPFESGDLRERIKGVTSEDFKFVKSYFLDDLQRGVSEELNLKDFHEGKVENRTLSDDFTSRNVFSGTPFVYNNMLHLSNITTKWFSGYNPLSFVEESKEEDEENNTGGGSSGDNTGGGASGNVYICSVCGYTYDDSKENIPFEEQNEYDYKCPLCGVGKDKFESGSGNDYSLYNSRSIRQTIESLQGVSFIFSNDVVSVGNCTVMSAQNFGYMIAYPSANMKLRIKAIDYDKENNLYRYFEEERITENADFLNMSFLLGDVVNVYYDASFKKTEDEPYAETIKARGQKINRIKLINGERHTNTIKDDSFLIENFKNTEKSENLLKVSDVLNPLIFPVAQTYQIGQGEIRNLAVVDTALSQGQFGQFPLYVFCSDGIYALNVGTDVAYTNIAPVSRDVITGDIISIDKAVVFISDRGLKIMQGDKATDVSLVMQSNSYEQLQGDTFEEFIKEAKLGYNYFFGEIYMFNENYDYAYVYELNNQTWGTRKIEFKNKIDVYPDLYMQTKDGVVYRLSKELLPDARTHRVKLKTRPMAWGDGFKKVARMIVRSLVIGRWTIRILASNDGVNFHELRNVNIDTNVPKRDIPFRRISGSFMSYVLEIDADMDERAYIEFIETELQDSIFNKKIR